MTIGGPGSRPHDDPDEVVDRLVAKALDPSNTRKISSSLAQLLGFIRQRIGALGDEDLVRLKLTTALYVSEEKRRREGA